MFPFLFGWMNKGKENDMAKKTAKKLPAKKVKSAAEKTDEKNYGEKTGAQTRAGKKALKNPSPRNHRSPL